MSSAAPRVIFGAPVYNAAPYLEEALGSLLAQTERDLRVVLIDDASTDGTAEMAAAIAARDERVSLHRNAVRVGMLENTRRAWAVARTAWPATPHWALGSDHDLWAPTWLEQLLDALERRPAAVLAYPRSCRIDSDGRVIPGLRTWRCETAGEADPWRRLRRAYRCMTAGDMIYGLFRAEALDRVGTYKPVLVPDRLLLAELALEGEFVQVPEILWQRRFVGLADLERQRRAFWPDGAPVHARQVPWWLTHAAVVAWKRGVHGHRGERETGFRLAFELVGVGARLRLVRRLQHLRRRLGAALEGPTRMAFSVALFRRAIERRALPLPEDTQRVLERLLTEWRARA
jgi:glycosyltransferase involved in cell wall biosynthesis